MTWWVWVLIIVAALVLLGFAFSLSDLRRYIRMRSM